MSISKNDKILWVSDDSKYVIISTSNHVTELPRSEFEFDIDKHINRINSCRFLDENIGRRVRPDLHRDAFIVVRVSDIKKIRPDWVADHDDILQRYSDMQKEIGPRLEGEELILAKKLWTDRLASLRSAKK